MEQHEATLRLVAAVKKAEAELRPLMAEAGIYLVSVRGAGVEIQGYGAGDMPRAADHTDETHAYTVDPLDGVRVVRTWLIAEPAQDPTVAAMDTVTEEG